MSVKTARIPVDPVIRSICSTSKFSDGLAAISQMLSVSHLTCFICLQQASDAPVPAPAPAPAASQPGDFCLQLKPVIVNGCVLLAP